MNMRAFPFRIVFVSLILVAFCGGGATLVWTQLIAEYNDLPACPAHLMADSQAEDPFTAFRDNGEYTTPELDEPLIVAGRTLTDYGGLAWQPGYDHGYAQEDNTRVISTNDRYISVPIPDVASLSVSHDRRTAAVVPYESEADDTETRHDYQLGLMDLTTAELTWIDLPGDPVDAEWSPTDPAVLLTTEAKDSVMVLDPETGDVATVTLAAPDGVESLLGVEWTPGGTQFVAQFSTGDGQVTVTVHERDGEAVRSIESDTWFGGFSPSGNRYLEGDAIVDMATGDTYSSAGLAGCSAHGNVHSFDVQTWVDEDHVLVIQEETEWPDDHRWGEPGEEPRGARLVIADLEGRVTEVITDWGDPLPDSLHFAP
jgi:hypothetical protein